MTFQIKQRLSKTVIGSSLFIGLSLSALQAFSSPEMVGNYQGSPYATWDGLYEQNVQVRTFAQPLVNNPSEVILRRFLQYIPQKIYERQSQYPLVIVLHGGNSSPELVKEFSMQDRWERLADKEQFMLAYGNAYNINNDPAPLESDAPYWANGGYWRSCVGGPGAGPDFYNVDDVDYIKRVISQMQSEALPIDMDRIYIIGLSNGGELAEHIASQSGDLIAGAGSVVPVYGAPKNIPSGPCAASEQAATSLIRIYSPQDPVLAPIFNSIGLNYKELIQQTSAAWVHALGLNPSTANVTYLENSVSEGDGYTGSIPWALNTMNSYAIRTDYEAANNGADFAEIQLIGAGHGWPEIKGATFEAAESSGQFGFHNQDFVAEEVIWEFLKSKRKIK